MLINDQEIQFPPLEFCSAPSSLGAAEIPLHRRKITEFNAAHNEALHFSNTIKVYINRKIIKSEMEWNAVCSIIIF